jgi:hypothetical protein
LTTTTSSTTHQVNIARFVGLELGFKGREGKEGTKITDEDG